MWRLVVEAPFEEDIELAVIDDEGVHALVFPCQRLPGGWANALTGEMLDQGHPKTLPDPGRTVGEGKPKVGGWVSLAWFVYAAA